MVDPIMKKKRKMFFLFHRFLNFYNVRAKNTFILLCDIKFDVNHLWEKTKDCESKDPQLQNKFVA